MTRDLAKALLTVALAVAAMLAFSFLGAACPPPGPTGGTGGTVGALGGSQTASGGEVVVDAGTSTGGTVEACQWVPSGRTSRRAEELPRIVNGQPSADGQFPWAVALENRGGGRFCGASVVGPRKLLTAAHCQVEPGEIAHMGTVDLREPGRKIEISLVKNHVLWTGTTSGHDVAILDLASNTTISPVKLADGASSIVATRATAIGWGATCEDCSTTPLQRYTELDLISRASCFSVYPGLITSDMLCAGGVNEDGLPTDSCYGDSGGPLVIMQDGEWVQLALTSWGRGCARPGVPGVYSSVAALRSWIEACIR